MSIDLSEHDDVVDVLTRYAPNPRTVSHEWTAARSSDVLTAIVGDDVRGEQPTRQFTDEIPIRFAPGRPDRAGARRRPARISPVAASVAVLALAAGTIVALLASNGSDRPERAAGPAFDPPAGLSTATLRDGQYSHLVDKSFQLDAAGKPVADPTDDMIDRNWVSPDGSVLSIRTGAQNECYRFRAGGDPAFGTPTREFFASLPTDVDALNKYVRSHVSGSSSLDEAVFVAVGDALRTTDGLASPRLKAAFVAVLSRTPGVVVHEGQRDYFGRAAVRADFVDQATRPGEISSLYFDSSTFRLLEERFSHNTQPGNYDGPSPAYDAPRDAGDDPDVLTGPTSIDIVTTQDVVDALPTPEQACTDA